MGLLNAYGKYTCFAPDNEAVQKLYALQGKNSIDEIPLDTIKKIVYDHIIKDFVIPSSDFVNGFLPNLTMSGRFVKIDFETTDGKVVYKVNSTATINIKDIQLHNGIVHNLSEVLLPTDNTLIEAISSDEKFSLFFEALLETGLNYKLEPIKDENYEFVSEIGGFEDNKLDVQGLFQRIPRERKYGFTALMESNATFANYGINNLDDMKAYAKQVYDQMYPDDANITNTTDSTNSLYRFIAYHLINKKISSKFFIEKFDNTGQFYESKGETHSVKTVDMYEYLETMCLNTLIEVRTLRTTNEYNIFNMTDNGSAIRLTDDFDNDALNGVYHEIDNILTYNADVDRMLSSKRLRMDAASFFPEFVNNNIRVGHASPDYQSEIWLLPQGYIDRVKASQTTSFRYINSDDRFCDYQGDEVFLKGVYDFEITTLPIPAGTYEVRFGYQPTGGRGVAQLYWDGIPTGIPLDLRIYANDPRIGHETPGTNPDDPEGYENDKMMRNRGYMKGPASYQVIRTDYYSGNGRTSPAVLRRILGIYTFDKFSTHVFKVSAVKGGQFMFDYLEFVPIEVLEYEDIN
jgi:uncharacterized surface protein with fasciclin (FAS1) repeats